MKIRLNTSDLMMKKYNQSIMRKSKRNQSAIVRSFSRSTPISSTADESNKEGIKLPEIKKNINISTTGSITVQESSKNMHLLPPRSGKPPLKIIKKKSHINIGIGSSTTHLPDLSPDIVRVDQDPRGDIAEKSDTGLRKKHTFSDKQLETQTLLPAKPHKLKSRVGRIHPSHSTISAQ